MIQVFDYRIALGDRDPDQVQAVIADCTERIMRLNPVLRGLKTQVHEGVLSLQLRCAGHNRWAVSRDSRQIATSLLRRAKLPWREATLESLVTETSRRRLTPPTGRPTNTARTRARREGKPGTWDHIPFTQDL